MQGTVEMSSVLRVLRVSHEFPSRAEGDSKEPSLEAGQLALMIPGHDHQCELPTEAGAHCEWKSDRPWDDQYYKPSGRPGAPPHTDLSSG